MDSRNSLRARGSAIYVLVGFLGVLLIHEYVIGPLLAPAREVPYTVARIAGAPDPDAVSP